MRTLDLDIVATRGSTVESRHAVHAAVICADDALIAKAGTPDLVAHRRSCAKPLQVHPFVNCGHFDAVCWTDAELALACTSHGGEPEHVAVAAAMLRSVRREEGDLACGAHDSLTTRGARLLREQDRHAGRLHNNCSGKHAAMLASARSHGWATPGYEMPITPVRLVMRQSLSRWTGLDAGVLDIATDGCGVPVFILSLRQMATAFARFARAAHDEVAAHRIFSAMATHPFLVGGTDRFDTVLMQETAGAVIAKVGAEGMHTVALRDRVMGLAFKVADGNPRAQWSAVLRLLQHLDVLPAVLPPRLHDFFVTPIRDTRGDVVREARVAA